jgi:predicted transcriptional regulator
MVLRTIVEKLGLQVKSGGSGLDREVTGAYASDLLSDVLANAKKGDLLITLQIHPNVVAVATLKELAGVVVVGGRQPEEETVRKAEEEEIPLLTSALQAFPLAGKLYTLIGEC